MNVYRDSKTCDYLWSLLHKIRTKYSKAKPVQNVETDMPLHRRNNENLSNSSNGSHYRPNTTAHCHP